MKNRLQFLEQNNLDEVVFINRNRSYGAYVLRNDYSNNLTKSLFVGIGLFVSMSMIPLLVSYFTHTEVVEVPPVVNGPFILKEIEPRTKKTEQVQAAQSNVKTVNTTVPTPTRNVAVDKPLPNKKDMENAAVGVVTKAGDDADVVVNTAVVTGPTIGEPVYTVPVQKPLDPEKVFTGSEADVAANYKGGINAFRQKVINNFDTSSVADDALVSAVITFIVEKDGSVSNIKVTGDNLSFNKEAERTVKSIKTKWSPAQFKGENVRSSFRMPISMKLE